MSKIVVYFSRADYNYFNGSIRKLKKGNTEIAAEMISQLTNAEMFKVEPMVPYSSDYSECIEQAKNDQIRDARPELREYPESLEGYDTVYLCYPNYWGTMPMAMFTFLDRFNLSGKIVKPLCTHEGSGMGRSEGDIKLLCPNADVKKGLSIQGYKVKDSLNDIKNWV